MSGSAPEPSPTLHDPRRRRWVRLTTLVGGAGAVAVAVPFVRSLNPSERALAQGGPVEVALAQLAPGGLETVEWRGRPVWVFRRTPAQVQSLESRIAFLADPASRRSEQPAYARNPTRSVRPELGVLVAICTHLGCVPLREAGLPINATDTLDAGFRCPCHGSKFDLAGRVFSNVPAPTNLTVPPYRYAGGGRIVIGLDPGA